MINLLLFLQFFEYGLLCFGGGYMIIPLLYADLVLEEGFLTPECYGNLLSISQLTPGPVSINTATYVGYLRNSILGSLFATLGLCVPTFVLSSIVLKFIYGNKDNKIINGFFKGAKWAAFVMIVYAACLFANISVLETPVNTETLLSVFKNGSFNIFHIKLVETVILILSIILIKTEKIPFTLLLICFAFVGWGISFLIQ